MNLKIELPEEVVALLGDDPEREALEALLLHLIRTDRVSVAWAGKRLGLDRQEAVRWYTSHGYPYPDITPEEFDEELRYVERLTGVPSAGSKETRGAAADDRKRGDAR